MWAPKGEKQRSGYQQTWQELQEKDEEQEHKVERQPSGVPGRRAEEEVEEQKRAEQQC